MQICFINRLHGGATVLYRAFIQNNVSPRNGETSLRRFLILRLSQSQAKRQILFDILKIEY